MRLGMAQFEGDPAVDREVLVVFAAFCVFYGVLCIPRFDSELGKSAAAWLQTRLPQHPLNRTWNSAIHAALAVALALACISRWTRADWVCGMLYEAQMGDDDVCYNLNRPVMRLSRLFMAHEAAYFLSDSIFMDAHNYRAFLPHHVFALFCIGNVSTKWGAIGLMPATALFLPIEMGGLAYHLDRARTPKIRSMGFVVVFTATRLLFFVVAIQVCRYVLTVARKFPWTATAGMCTLLVVGVIVLLTQNMLWLRQQLLAARRQHTA